MDTRDAITKAHFNQEVTFESTGLFSLGEYVVDATLAARLTGAPDGSRITLEIDESDDANYANFKIHHRFRTYDVLRHVGSAMLVDANSLHVATRSITMTTPKKTPVARLKIVQAKGKIWSNKSAKVLSQSSPVPLEKVLKPRRKDIILRDFEARAKARFA